MQESEGAIGDFEPWQDPPAVEQRGNPAVGGRYQLKACGAQYREGRMVERSMWCGDDIGRSGYLDGMSLVQMRIILK